MVRHIVMWRLKAGRADGAGRADFEAIKERLEALVTSVPPLRSLRFGADFSSTDASFDVVLETEFAHREDLEAYRVHPVHKEAAAFIGELVTERAVVDYEF